MRLWYRNGVGSLTETTTDVNLAQVASPPILRQLSNVSFPRNDQTLEEQVELFKFTRGGHTN